MEDCNPLATPLDPAIKLTKTNPDVDTLLARTSMPALWEVSCMLHVSLDRTSCAQLVNYLLTTLILALDTSWPQKGFSAISRGLWISVLPIVHRQLSLKSSMPIGPATRIQENPRLVACYA